MSINDIHFKKHFSLTVLRKDYIHALVSYYVVDFTRCHKPISISTAPECKHTRFRQTLYFLNPELIAQTNESIDGEFEMNYVNSNRVDFNINIEFDGALDRGKQKNFYCVKDRDF